MFRPMSVFPGNDVAEGGGALSSPAWHSHTAREATNGTMKARDVRLTFVNSDITRYHNCSILYSVYNKRNRAALKLWPPIGHQEHASTSSPLSSPSPSWRADRSMKNCGNVAIVSLRISEAYLHGRCGTFVGAGHTR